jgi:hypothetical protein
MNTMTELLGTWCPVCNETKPNPRAQHERREDGTVEFRNIVQAVGVWACLECRGGKVTVEPMRHTDQVHTGYRSKV